MPYAKGQSGNPKGRPKQTAEQKSQRSNFRGCLNLLPLKLCKA